MKLSQERKTQCPIHPIDGNYIKEWLVLGPFLGDLETDFLADAGGEANIAVQEGDTVTTADGRTLIWKRYRSKGNIIDLRDAVGTHDKATIYAYCMLQSEIEATARVHFGNESVASVFINGKRIHHAPIPWIMTVDGQMFSANLKVGANRCLVKGNYYFAMRAGLHEKITTDESGQRHANTPIHSDSDGYLWFATQSGVTRYRPNRTPSVAKIVAVTTDQRYTDLNAIEPAIENRRITFEFDSIDFKTQPDKRIYRYKLDAHDKDWNLPTRATEVDYADVPVGKYTFYVQAIDRDGNYSSPASVTLTVEPDPKLISLQNAVDRLRLEVGRKYSFDSIIGRSAPIEQMFALMERAIDSGLTVLITGETGTGKELVAHAIHYNGPRNERPLLELNCGAVPKDLIASTLFGHRKGAFTGAIEERSGLFETAVGGTVILDEIGEMPEEAQIALLRVLQEREVQRLGEFQSRSVDVRVIAMTNRNLRKSVEVGDFREDLYYRLNVFRIHLPPLRERTDDLPLLVEYFLHKACREMNKEIDGFAPDVLEMLATYSWSGNVRELENEINRAVALVEDGLEIQTYHFSPEVSHGETLLQASIDGSSGYSEMVTHFQRRLIEQTLAECDGNRHEAARRLRMNRSNLLRLIKRLGIG